MVVIPKEYYTKEKKVKLTQQEIEAVIDELARTEHNIFTFLNYDKIIKKLKSAENTRKEKLT